MSRPDRTRLDDPTAENTADTSTQSASGISTPGARHRGERGTDREEVVRRTATSRQRDSTPRRYERPAEDDPA
jgi:hypothetical protein